MPYNKNSLFPQPRQSRAHAAAAHAAAAALHLAPVKTLKPEFANSAERKKTDNPREGWEDGTLQPNSSAENSLFPTAGREFCDRSGQPRAQPAAAASDHASSARRGYGGRAAVPAAPDPHQRHHRPHQAPQLHVVYVRPPRLPRPPHTLFAGDRPRRAARADADRVAPPPPGRRS